MSPKPAATSAAIVRKIIESPHPEIPEKAEIVIDDCDELYREPRILNILTGEIEAGCPGGIIVEAERTETIPKS
jgi:hypothetical protein